MNAYGELKEPRKAPHIPEAMQAWKAASLDPMYGEFLWVNKAVCHFDLKEYTKADKTPSRLYTSGFYKGLDQHRNLKIETAELIMRFERRDEEFAEIKIPRLMKESGPETKAAGENLSCGKLFWDVAKKGISKKKIYSNPSLKNHKTRRTKAVRILIDYTKRLNNSKSFNEKQTG